MKTTQIKKQLPDILGIAAGSIASGFVSSKLPFANEKLKAAAPAILGLFLSSQKGMVGSFGKGLIVGSAQKLAASFGIGSPTTMIGSPFVRYSSYVGAPNPATGAGGSGTFWGKESNI